MLGGEGPGLGGTAHGCPRGGTETEERAGSPSKVWALLLPPPFWTVTERLRHDTQTPTADQKTKVSTPLAPCCSRPGWARLSGPLPVILTQTDRRRDELWWGSRASGLTCPVAWPEPSEHTNCTNSFSESCPWWWW